MGELLIHRDLCEDVMWVVDPPWASITAVPLFLDFRLADGTQKNIRTVDSALPFRVGWFFDANGLPILSRQEFILPTAAGKVPFKLSNGTDDDITLVT